MPNKILDVIILLCYHTIMKLINFPNIRSMIDEYGMWYPASEFGPGHIVISDYNVENHHLYYCMDNIDRLLMNTEEKRLLDNDYYTTENLNRDREFFKELLAIEEIVRQVSINLYTNLLDIDCNDYEAYKADMIRQCMEVDIHEWIYKIDFSSMDDFDYGFYKTFYDMINS